MRVVLLDHALYRLGLRLMLEASSDCEVVGEANSPRAAFEVVSAFVPDVVVIDPVLPGLRGGRAIRKIRGCAPRVRVLILTEHFRIRDVAVAMAAGASGYALKGDSNDEILEAVRRVHRGRLYLSPALDPGIDVNLDVTQALASQDLAI